MQFVLEYLNGIVTERVFLCVQLMDVTCRYSLGLFSSSDQILTQAAISRMQDKHILWKTVSVI